MQSHAFVDVKPDQISVYSFELIPVRSARHSRVSVIRNRLSEAIDGCGYPMKFCMSSKDKTIILAQVTVVFYRKPHQIST